MNMIVLVKWRDGWHHHQRRNRRRVVRLPHQVGERINPQLNRDPRRLLQQRGLTQNQCLAVYQRQRIPLDRDHKCGVGFPKQNQ